MYGKNTIDLLPGCRLIGTDTRITIPNRRLFLFGMFSPGILKGKQIVPDIIFSFPKAGTECTGFGKMQPKKHTSLVERITKVRRPPTFVK